MEISKVFFENIFIHLKEMYVYVRCGDNDRMTVVEVSQCKGRELQCARRKVVVCHRKGAEQCRALSRSLACGTKLPYDLVCAR